MASTYTFSNLTGTTFSSTTATITTANITTLNPTIIAVGASGVTPISTPSGFCNKSIFSVTAGTNTTMASGTQMVTSIWVPVNFTVTNINFLIGGTGGTNKVYGVLYDSTGAVLGNSSLTSGGATVGTASTIQTLALTSTVAIKGPGIFFVGISYNGNTATLATIPAHLQDGLWAGQVSQVHGTVAAITAPSTFTADKGPFVFLN